jgi:hypothetical protein
MEIEFVDRNKERPHIKNLIRPDPGAPHDPRVISLDSPAGLGKTRLLFKVCEELGEETLDNGKEWRIVWLDFRRHFLVKFSNKKDVIEQIARQICRDTQWESIINLVREQANAPNESEIVDLIKKAALISMDDESRRALLELVTGLEPARLAQIGDRITKLFEDVDIEAARDRGELQSVVGLVGFILANQARIPDQVLIILDGVDAIVEDRFRCWTVNDLALGLALHAGIQGAFGNFAVIVSGRFIEQDIDPARRRCFQDIVLQSFVDKSGEVGRLLKQFGDTGFNQQGEMVAQLARKLCQACGGHPKVIKETAKSLYEAPGHFAALDMNPEGAHYWYDRPQFRKKLTSRRKEAILEIMEDVDEQEQSLLRLLSIFRRFNPAVLQFLFDRFPEGKDLNFPRHLVDDNVRDLYDRLKQTRLIGNDKRIEPFDSDRFSLSLLSAQMRDKDPKMFRVLNKLAMTLFANWIKGNFEDIRGGLQNSPLYQGVCVREWLFHRLYLSHPCATLRDANQRGQQISEELKGLLEEKLFSAPFDLKQLEEDLKQLEEEEVPAILRQQFKQQRITLTSRAAFKVDSCGNSWTIVDGNREYSLRYANCKLSVYQQNIVAHPFESATVQRERIREEIEADEQIDHLIWEIAFEDHMYHAAILDEILQAF